MLGNLVTSQVVRYVTDRVMENLTHQAGRAVDGQFIGSAGPAEVAALAQIQNRFDALGERLNALDRQLERLDERLAKTEARTGWRYTLRLTVGVVVGIAVGFGAAELAHVAGLLGAAGSPW